MRWLVDESLPRGLVDLLRQYGHEALDVRDIRLRGADDDQIASYARSEGLCIVTADLDFVDVRSYPPREYAGIVVLRLPRLMSVPAILSLVENILRREDILTQLPGKLTIVEPRRVRMRES